MIIDLLNFCQHSAGTEADILFRLQESGIRVPPFFCITEDFTEDELNNYLQNHFQHTTHFIVRLSLSYDNSSSGDINLPEYEPPHYMHIQKSIIVRYAERLFSEARDYIGNHCSNSIKACVIVQEMVNATVFGGIQTACNGGALNETMITIGKGYNSDFIERGVPFSIYCHNDTDNILFAYEAEGALTAERSLVRKLLNISNDLKVMFRNCHLTIKFIVDYETRKLYLISVNKIAELSDAEEDNIILDTKGVCNYYPGVTKPLNASIALMLSRQIMLKTLHQIGYKKIISPELMEYLVYVNGRLYFDTKRLKTLQILMSFHENTEEFVNLSGRLFWKHLLEGKGVSTWRSSRNIALKLNKLLENNLNQRDEICQKLRQQLKEYSNYDPNTNDTHNIQEIFNKIISSLSDCLCSNLFNTLYIKMKRRFITRQKSNDKKYIRSVIDIKRASDFRKEIRIYHGKFIKLLDVYGIRTGQAFVDMGILRKAEDLFMLTYDESISLFNGKLPNSEKLIAERYSDFEWYESLPSFSRLIFHDKVLSAPTGVVHFLDVIKNPCFIRCSGIRPGHAKLPVIVCCNDNLPENVSKDHIYAVKNIPQHIPVKGLGGLIIEAPVVFAELTANYPVLCGAEHICTLAAKECVADIDGKTGDITLTFSLDE